MVRLLSFLILPVCTALLSAQATIIVDVNAGAGFHYRKLEKAIANANSGDILIVRAGKYNFPNVVTKPLTIQGVGPATEVSALGWFPKVSGIPAGSSFVMKDMLLISITFGIEFSNCAGEVLLDRLEAAPYYTIPLRATNAAAFTVRRCQRSVITALDSFVQIQGGSVGPWSSEVISAWRSTVELVDVGVTGGFDTGGHGAGVFPKDAIRVRQSELRIKGASSVSVMKSPVNVQQATPLIGDVTSKLVMDPGVVIIQPNAGAWPIWGFGRGVVRTAMPTLKSTVLPKLGQPWSYTLKSQASDPYVIAIGLPLPPTPFLGDFLRIDPRVTVILNVGQLGASGTATFQLVHTSNRIYRGHLFLMQGAVGSGPMLTNAMSLSVR